MEVADEEYELACTGKVAGPKRRMAWFAALASLAIVTLSCRRTGPPAPPASVEEQPSPTSAAPSSVQQQDQSTLDSPNSNEASRPKTAILFQPELIFEDEEPRHQGTGFFVHGPDGKTIAVTSAHFVEFDGPRLRKIRWLDVRTNERVATMTRSWGKPGQMGRMDPPLDLRSDYLLMPVKAKIASDRVLDLDERAHAVKEERVWFPNKQERSELGFHIVEGVVVDASEEVVYVVLDDKIKLQSQSGSPVLSQESGKVIGTLAGGGDYKETSYVVLTPSSAIVGAIHEAKSFPPLKSVVGIQPKKSSHRPKKPRKNNDQ